MALAPLSAEQIQWSLTAMSLFLYVSECQVVMTEQEEWRWEKFISTEWLQCRQWQMINVLGMLEMRWE